MEALFVFTLASCFKFSFLSRSLKSKGPLVSTLKYNWLTGHYNCPKLAIAVSIHCFFLMSLLDSLLESY